MFDEKNVLAKLESLTDEEFEYLNKRMDSDSNKQHAAFKQAYEKGECYLCGKSFKTISKEKPCLHWLLRQCKFKPKDITLIYSSFGYTNISAFLRWCANSEKHMVNINDMSSEIKAGKVISNTIKWKNIEWTFDCSESDFRGHSGTAIDYPHYHFQMRIDGRQFINFNSYHLPFSADDLFAITMSRNHPDKFFYNFGEHGGGMELAMDMIGEDSQSAFEHMILADNEDEAIYHMSTTIIAEEGKTISGDLIADLIEKSKATGEPLGSLVHKHMSSTAKVSTYISASENTPEIAARTEHKRR